MTKNSEKIRGLAAEIDAILWPGENFLGGRLEEINGAIVGIYGALSVADFQAERRAGEKQTEIKAMTQKIKEGLAEYIAEQAEKIHEERGL